MTTWNAISQQIADAVNSAAPSIVQVHGRRRMAAGIVFADNLVVTTAPVDDDTVAVRSGTGATADGAALGRIGSMGLTVVRVNDLGLRPLPPATEDPAPGHLAVAIGRTWSGGVMAALAPIAVVGGPLRTGRRSAIERVIRIQHAPHGALSGGALLSSSGGVLGIITPLAIRGTTMVIPASLAFPEAARTAASGGTKQGFLGVSSMPVVVPERQRAGRSQQYGLLISQVSSGSPAEQAGLLVGDLLVGFDGGEISDPEDLVTRLRGDRIGAAVPVTVIRGTNALDVTVTVGERPSR
jgi:S1-C subfamily serine protease